MPGRIAWTGPVRQLVLYSPVIQVSSSPDEVTQLLRRWSHGDQGALNELMPLIYGELHKLAKRHMARQEAGHTLPCCQPR